MATSSKRLFRALALAPLLAIAAPSSQGGAPPPPQSTPKSKAVVNADSYTSARVCGECHADIYNSWKNSLHAFSLTDPIFDAAFMQALKEVGDQAKQVCLRCHAPMTMVNGDYDLKLGVTREGVSCDFCHTVTAVDLDKPTQPYTIDLGLVKRSVLKKAASPAHEVAYSELHGTSEFCAGCHNYFAPSGVPILGTYEEWRQGPYPGEGKQCQHCHMVMSEGRVVSKEVKESSTEIHLHDLIHDTDQLRSALTVQILEIKRSEDRLQVQVQIENVGSGHMVPTGIPSREIVLTVTVNESGRIKSQERHYRKVVADKDGNPLNSDHQALLFGARILNDNRLRPREKRFEQMTFDVRRSGGAEVTASLTYSYRPMVLHERPVEIKLGHVQRTVY